MSSLNTKEDGQANLNPPNPDQLDVEELKIKIDDMYTQVALQPDEVYHFKMGRDLAESLGYPSDELDKLPYQSIESFAGVGYYFDIASLKSGEKVLDLGSGSGLDLFYAAKQVGETGEVVGVDINQEQVNKTKRLKNEYGIKNVRLIKTDIEDLPFDDNTFDVVISNGVFNLIPNKQVLFHEIDRILKPTGRLAFSDIVTDTQLPTNVKCDSTLWASCIGGAEQREVYIRLMENVNLSVKKMKYHENYKFNSDQARGASEKWGVKSYSFLATREKNQ